MGGGAFVQCPHCQHVGRVVDAARFRCAICGRVGATADHAIDVTCSECPREPLYRLYDAGNRFLARGDFRCPLHTHGYTMSYVTL